MNTKPFWPDDCKHGTDAYICSYVYHTDPDCPELDYTYKIDVYVYKPDYAADYHACLRFGTQGEYFSGTCLGHFCKMSIDYIEPAQAIIRALIEQGFELYPD